jgi:hypothetical protein
MTERAATDVLARALRRLAARTPLRITAFLLLATCAALPMLEQARGMNQFYDAQFLSAYEEHARIAALHFGQLPLWDPYNCGGIYGLAAPQTRYGTPFFLLSLGLGVDAGAALLALLLMALGMEGMFRYARSWGVSDGPAFLCAPLFPLCGWFPTAWAVGWVQYFSFCGLPWILLGARGALRGRRAGAYLCAVACALTLGIGGTWTLPIGVFLFLSELGAALLPRRWLGLTRGAAPALRARRALGGLLATAALTLGVGAHRLWPMLESIGTTTRVMGGEPWWSAGHLLRTLLLPHGEDDSYFVTPLIALALFSLSARRWLPLWLAALAVFALALGHVAPQAPFALLRQLPIYDGMRYPERFLSAFAVAAAVLTASGAGALLARLRLRRGRRAAGVAYLVLAAAFAVGFLQQIRNGHAIVAGVGLEPRPTPRADASFRQSRGNRWLMSHFAAEGLGALGCGEAYAVPMSPLLRGDLAREEYLVAPDATQPEQARAFPQGARRVRWSPNALELAVDTQREARLAINQNYHPGWHSDVGRVESWDGLLSVVLPPGQHHVSLRFLPRSGLAGPAVALIALLSGALWVLRPPRAWAARALCVGSGPLLIAACLAIWPEAAWTYPAPRTPDGEPVLIERLPADARPAGARFDVPLVLEGARLPAALPAGARELPVDLFFRREGPLAATLGIFVHVRKPGTVLKGDHGSISGQVYLPRAPLDTLTRDAFRIALPAKASGDWEVAVGLWNAYGDGQRRVIVDPGTLSPHDGALRIGRVSVP